VKPGNLQRGEWIAIAGALLLALSVFLDWYHLSGNAVLQGHHAPASLSGWQAHPIMRFLLLAAAAAPLILAWIIVREHELSWPRGQVTMIVAIAAMGLVFYVGVIERPGDPSGDIKLRLGWYLALLASILMLVGSVMRQSESGAARKPPGTI
jgi:predicted lysophospholipase L1 biosynthesis ABC-type transport system permease subunit